MNAAALFCRANRTVSPASLACAAGLPHRRCRVQLLLGQRRCLEQLRQAALADTNRFLTAALGARRAAASLA